MRPVAILVALCVAVDAGAQTSSSRSPDAIVMQFVRFADIFGGRLIAAFDSIPAASYGYRPSPTQQSIGFIAQHLEEANYGLCERVGALKRPEASRTSLPDTIKARWPKDTLVARLRASLDFCDSAVRSVPELNSPALASTLLAFETDLAEHYAQIASYMRMLNLVPPSALPPKPRKAIELPVAALSELVGTYEIGPGWQLVIAPRDGGISIASSMGGDPVPLWPESRADFFVKEVDAQVTFTRDGSGKVAGLLLHQNGRVRPARKIR